MKMGKSNGFLIGVVDDHVQTAISICHLLEANGFKTFQEYNSQDAIEKTRTEKPDLLILDIKIDDKNGYDIAEQFPKQKIIFFSGFDVNTERIKKLKNVVGVLVKPVDNEDLLKMVRKQLKLPTPKEI